MISSTSYVTKWYITLFANSFSFQTQLRIWDAFFLEGQDIIIIVAVAIIWALKGIFYHLATNIARRPLIAPNHRLSFIATGKF